MVIFLKKKKCVDRKNTECMWKIFWCGRERKKERGERKEAETRGGNECLAADTHQHSPEEIKLPPVWLGFSAICIEFESVSQTPSYFTGVRKEGLQSISETQSLPLLGMTGKSLWRSRNCRSTGSLSRSCTTRTLWLMGLKGPGWCGNPSGMWEGKDKENHAHRQADRELVVCRFDSH